MIIDEEQEHTYQSESAPRYHAREVAQLPLLRIRQGALVPARPLPPRRWRAIAMAQDGAIYVATSCRTGYGGGRRSPRCELVDMNRGIAPPEDDGHLRPGTADPEI